MAYLEPVWVSFFHHSISVTQFLSLITHNSSLNTHFFTFIWQHYFYFHHSIFSHYSWVPHLSTGTIFFFFSVPNSPKLILKKKKKVKKWSKVAAVGPLCVFNYNITIKLWVMETENNKRLFSVFSFHNS